jgi:hypothetical protein
MGSRLRKLGDACCLLAGILLFVFPAVAQVELGGTKMDLSGDIGANYTGSMNQGDSAHNLGFVGDANLTGYYYHPNFLSFAVRPFYNRSQSNSAFGALTNSSGVNSSVNFFNGSHFPGTVSYNRVDNSSGEYGIPGAGIGLATNGSNQGFAIGWSALLPDLPTLTASYAVSSGSESIYGSPGESKQTDRDLTLLSTYNVAGFRIAGGYSHRNLDGSFSELLEGVPEPVNSNTSTNNYQVNANHSFPMSGGYSVSYSRTTYDYNDHDGSSTSSSGASDTVNGNLNFRPADKLSIGVNASYNDSLLGSLPEPIVNGGAGGIVSLGTFRSFNVGANADYQLLHNLSLRGTVIHVDQIFLGQHYQSTQFGGSAYYNMEHNLLRGLSFSIAAFDSADKQGNTGLGFTGNLNYNRKFARWDLDANYSYSQNVATQVVIYTSSSMSWVTNMRRRVGNRSYFMAGYSGSHSGLTVAAGDSSSAERVSSTFTYGRYSVNGFYSKSRGTAEFTSTGLVALPPNLPPSALPPGSVIVFDSKAYGFNGSASPTRRLSLSLGYAQSNGDTVDPLATTFTKNTLINGLMQYRLRKIYVNGGYTHLRQSVGTPGTSPISVTNYYIGISRWFNFF